MKDFDFIMKASKDGRITFTEQASDRKILTTDILNAIINHQSIIYKKEENKFNIYGQYSETHLLLVSCAYREGILIITVHKILKKRIKK
jgi:hypothetical protein